MIDVIFYACNKKHLSYFLVCGLDFYHSRYHYIKPNLSVRSSSAYAKLFVYIQCYFSFLFSSYFTGAQSTCRTDQFLYFIIIFKLPTNSPYDKSAASVSTDSKTALSVTSAPSSHHFYLQYWQGPYS